LDAFSDDREHDQLIAAEEIKRLEARGRVAPAAQAPSDGVEAIRQIFNSLRRRRRIILYSIAVGGAVTALAAIAFPPSYLATAQLILDLHQSASANAGAPGTTTVISSGAEDAAIDTHITALASDANLRRALHLLDPSSAGGSDKADNADNADNGDNGDNADSMETNAALLGLHRNLKVVQERRSRIISVGYYSSDPARAAQVANTVAQTYVNSLRSEKREEADLSVDRFTHRLAEVQDEVARAESAVQTYRQNHVTNDATGPSQTEQQITNTARQLMLLKSNAAANQQLINDVRARRSRGDPAQELAEALDSARLADLAKRADAARQAQAGAPDAKASPPPELAKAIDDEIAKSLSRLELEQQTYRAQIQSVENRLTVLRGAANQISDDTISLHELERKATALAQLYEALLRKRQDLVEWSKLAEPDIRVLALAEPPLHPSSLHRIFLVPPALIVFALLGSMIALTLDRLDRTLHGERETAEILQIPCAGLVPELTQFEARSIPNLLRNHPDAPYAKAIRSIFANTAPLCRADPDHRIILVTSSVPREGKTDLAWSLAIAAAQVQWNVLVLEVGRQTSPIRSQALDSMLFPTPAATLSDVAARRAGVASLVGSIPDSGISFMPLSRDNLDLLEQLTNPDFMGFFDQIRDAYDLVIIDAPSMLDCSEVRLLASRADKTLFAVRWGQTARETARTAIRILQTANHHRSGNQAVSVLTNANLRKHATYRFADQGDLLARGSI
jgi:uncharacterized protein involved in exopolysaccharide biosynthesis/Mrp family chromosome partitioning ATPase